jgi:hypothetical protein
VDERVRRAQRLHEQAVFTGAVQPLQRAARELDAAEADLALARGHLLHTRFLLERDADPAAAAPGPAELPLFERAGRLYRSLGDAGGQLAGVASNLVGLVYIAAAEGRRADALALAAEGSALARAAGAGRTLRELDEARAAAAG